LNSLTAVEKENGLSTAHHILSKHSFIRQMDIVDDSENAIIPPKTKTIERIPLEAPDTTRGAADFAEQRLPSGQITHSGIGREPASAVNHDAFQWAFEEPVYGFDEMDVQMPHWEFSFDDGLT
jgi:hypothetical protein